MKNHIKQLYTLTIILIIAVSFNVALTACSDRTTIVQPIHSHAVCDSFVVNSTCHSTMINWIDTCKVSGLGHRDPGHNQNGHIDFCGDDDN